MMNTKLTLTIEQVIIEKAESYAKEKGRSLSDIIENYLKIITTEQKTEMELSPFINSLRGSFKSPESFDYKEELSKGLSIDNNSCVTNGQAGNRKRIKF